MTKKRKKKYRPIHDLVFTDEELCQFWDWFHDNWTDPCWHGPAFYVALILVTGLRLDEARQIEVQHCVTFPVPLIYVAHAKGDKPREVEMIPQFEPIFIKRIEELREQLDVRGDHESPFLFPGRAGWPHYKPASLRTCDNWWHEATRAAGIRELTPHCGRYSFATYATRIPYPDKNGVSRYLQLPDLQGQLGHESIEMTAKLYRKSLPGARFPRNGMPWAPKWPDKIGTNNGN